MSNDNLVRSLQKIFASSSGTNQLAAFGSMVSGSPIYTDDIAQLQTDAYTEGWSAAVANNTAPFLQEFNGVQYALSYQIAYLLQKGLPEWSEGENYFENSYCQYNGTIYQSLTNNNLNNNPQEDGGTNWKAREFIQIATDSEALSGFLENVAINPKQLQTAISTLQTQIDAINAASDVTDVVGTYAQLQAYNTSTLAPNSIIKVLQDETQQSATTYYRWVIKSGTGKWELIGQEGPYYTIEQADNNFVKKTNYATTTTPGIVKIGSGLSVTTDGTLSANATSYTLPTATSSRLGGVKIGSNLSVTTDGTLSATSYSLPTATTTRLGGIKVGSNLSITSDGTLSVDSSFGINTPFFFGMSEYFQTEPNNASWLKSSGQWNSGNTYIDFYNWLVSIQNGSKKQAGISVKLSTASYNDYDFVINTSNKTFRLPLLNNSENVINLNKVLNSGNSSTKFTAPQNCWIYLLTGSNQNNGDGGSMSINSTNVAYLKTDNASVRISRMFYASKDEVADIQFGVNSEKSWIAYACKGNGTLYFYVGDTIQNATQIDAGKITEQLSDKIGRTECKAYIKETYKNGSSWYRIWSDGWCEQGGFSAGDNWRTITLLKTMKDNTYSVILTAVSSKRTGNECVHMSPDNKTTNSMYVSGWSMDATNCGILWEVKGYAV